MQKNKTSQQQKQQLNNGCILRKETKKVTAFKLIQKRKITTTATQKKISIATNFCKLEHKEMKVKTQGLVRTFHSMQPQQITDNKQKKHTKKT